MHQRGFLPAVLAGGRREGAADLANQSARRPQTARGVEKGPHLGRRRTIARRSAEDDRIGFGQPLGIGERHVGESLLGLDGPHLRQNLSRERLGDAKHLDLGSRDLARPFRDGLGQLIHVPVGAVKDHLHFRSHRGGPSGSAGAERCFRPLF